MNDLEKEMQKLKNGGLDALDEIYKIAARGVYFLACSILRNAESAKDIMQNTFIQVAKNIDKYKRDTNPLAWITKIARNLAYREYNNAKRNISLETFGDNITDNKNHEELFAENILLNSAMKILSTDEREIVILFAIEGYKHREISKIVERPMGTVQWIYNKSIKKLKKHMEGGNEG